MLEFIWTIAYIATGVAFVWCWHWADPEVCYSEDEDGSLSLVVLLWPLLLGGVMIVLAGRALSKVLP